MSITLGDVAKFVLTQTVAFTVREPLAALGATASISNPRIRGIVLEVAIYLGKEQLRQYQFLSRLVYTRLVLPAAAGTRTRAIAAATNPAVAIPAGALAAVAVGAAISANTTTWINETHNIPSSSPIAHWSPFGGMGFGSVVT